MRHFLTTGLAVLGISATLAYTEDLSIQLPANASISRITVQYQCNAQGPKMGLPSDTFSVEYINGGGNSLAVVPISGDSIIFSNVVAGSDARYAAKQYIWWEAKDAATLYSTALTGKLQSVCQPVQNK